jgi:hypothetical protein
MVSCDKGSLHFRNPVLKLTTAYLYVVILYIYRGISAIIVLPWDLCIISDNKIKTYSKFRFPRGMLTGMVGINRELNPKNVFDSIMQVELCYS